MNDEYTIQGTKLRSTTWRFLYSLVMLGWQISESKNSLPPDFRFALREMEINGLLTVTSADLQDPTFFTWAATDKLRDLYSNAEDEIKTLLEI